MRKIKSYIGLLLFAAIGFTGCQDEFDAPVLVAPEASIAANTTISELKTKYWEDGLNYIDTIGTTDAGARMIISGYVTSSDRTGNIYKNLVIEDETGALAMSINQSGLYNSYRIGQEVVIDVTGMYIGKYNGLQQLGWPDVDEVFGEQATFMPIEFFRQHAQLNGLPDEKNAQPTVVNLADIASFTVNDKEEMIEWQSRLVRFNNVRFEDGKGNLSYTDGSEINSNRTIYDEHGNKITVRNSGYATFWSDKLPKGYGDVVGILSYYDDAWQLLLRSTDDCMNFGNPTIPEPDLGTQDNPYTVTAAIEAEKAGTEATGVWVKGYIVGAVAPEIENVTSNDDIEWGAPTELDNTLVIADSANVKDFTQCLVISLPQDSELRKKTNLRENPDNLGKEIMLKGNLEKYMETYGITGNNGTTSEFKFAGEDSGSPIPAGDGSETSPYNVAQVLSGIEATGVWASGYIVGWVDGMTYATGVKFTIPATSETNVIIADTPDETDYSKCVPVQLPLGELRSAINLQSNPGNLGKKLNYKGSLAKYFGVRGLKEGTAYKLDGAGSGDIPQVPVEPLTNLDETFESGTSFAGINWKTVEVAGNKPWWIRNYNNNNYATVSGYNGTAPFDEWLITPPINISATNGKILTFETQARGYGATTSSLEVYVLTTDNPETATKTKLNATICDTPADAYSSWTGSGNIDLSVFSGTIYIAFRYQATADANYATYCLDNVKIGTGAGGGDDPTPPATSTAADLNTLNDGKAKSSYGTYSTAAGWVLENGNVLGGRTSGEDSNPYFAFIGEDGTLAACLNGKVSAPGKLTSPALAGGIKTLTFNYGFAYSDKQCKFTVNVKQGGTVAKTETVTLTSIEQKTAYPFTMDVNLSGDFTIEIVNDAMGGETGNKERVAIWNLSWTN